MTRTPCRALSVARAAPLMLAALVAVVPLGCGGGGGAEPPNPLDVVTIMSFNILNDDGHAARGIPTWVDGRDQLVVETIRLEAPDVIGLQEALVWQVEAIVDALPEYAFVGRARDAAGIDESVSILYRTDRFDLAESGHFWFSDTPDVPGSRAGIDWGSPSTARMSTWVRLTRRGTSRSFYVYNLHLPADGSAADGPLARSRFVELLVQRIANRGHPDDYFFVTGDFNTIESTVPVTYLRGLRCAAGTAGCPNPPPLPEFLSIDAWRMRNPADVRSGSQCANTSAGDGNRIDYVFVWDPAASVAPSSRVRDARIVKHGACASDHRPVVVDIEIPLASR